MGRAWAGRAGRVQPRGAALSRPPDRRSRPVPSRLVTAPRGESPRGPLSTHRGKRAPGIPVRAPLGWGGRGGTGRDLPAARGAVGGLAVLGPVRVRPGPALCPLPSPAAFPRTALPASRCPFLPRPDHVQVAEEDRGGEP